MILIETVDFDKRSPREHRVFTKLYIVKKIGYGYSICSNIHIPARDGLSCSPDSF